MTFGQHQLGLHVHESLAPFLSARRGLILEGWQPSVSDIHGQWHFHQATPKLHAGLPRFARWKSSWDIRLFSRWMIALWSWSEHPKSLYGVMWHDRELWPCSELVYVVGGWGVHSYQRSPLFKWRGLQSVPPPSPTIGLVPKTQLRTLIWAD